MKRTLTTAFVVVLLVRGHAFPRDHDRDEKHRGPGIDCATRSLIHEKPPDHPWMPRSGKAPDECEYRGDFDGDRVTTLRDFAAFERCFTGDTPGITDPCCRLFDLNEDNTVNLSDLPGIQRVFAGP
jgi:hypothetical protein